MKVMTPAQQTFIQQYAEATIKLFVASGILHDDATVSLGTEILNSKVAANLQGIAYAIVTDSFKEAGVDTDDVVEGYTGYEHIDGDLYPTTD